MTVSPLSLVRGSVLATVFAASAAFAGPVEDFRSDYREMYANYRTALFTTNAGRQEDAVQALSALEETYWAMRDTYGDTPPPQFADDPAWPETMEQVGGLLEQASAEVGAGELAAAHETLEGIRDLFGSLHLRNDIASFSDRMNAYHAEMEHVLGLDLSTTDMGMLRERAAVLDYLARRVLETPPRDAEGSAEYEKLATALRASADAFLAATRDGNADSVKAAVAGLKKPYSQMFLKFG
ncbi:hypothetical protein [Tropicimonas isoalkanivorans]|uniref:Imelysin n=1 Tax=Tropicimonas isoalkanivorans TaxID=441112 RepID=A0A1I1P6X9_9RHOB|nr:hypothetical protein [Tropicimonas isoalkanivorans]SFD05711.1 hypothetical protein SAMN04488094_11440 [Tropicimonas isoalkanivorans]